MKPKTPEELLSRAKRAPNSTDVPSLRPGFVDRVLAAEKVEVPSPWRLWERSAYAGVTAAAVVAISSPLLVSDDASPVAEVDPWMEMPMSSDY